jgi:hypothetical protein
MMEETKIQSEMETIQNWYKAELKKDNLELENEKKMFIQSIKNFKKEDIVPKPTKISLWKRIIKVITGN